MSRATPTLPITIPPDVLAFAEKEGVGPYLMPVLEMTQRVFPGGLCGVWLEDDPEIPDDWHIVIGVRVRLDVPEAVEADWQWFRDIFGVCPAPRVCVFRLGRELAA